MNFAVGARNAVQPHRIEQVSSIRPITLLIATGIAMITGLLMVTGIAANHLRQQALVTAASELARIDGILAASTNRALASVDSQLAEVAEAVEKAQRAGPGSFGDAARSTETTAAMKAELGRFPRIDAIALLGLDGEVLSRAGAWPVDAGRVRDIVAGIPSQPRQTSLPFSVANSSRKGSSNLALARRIDGAAGTPAGVIVGMIPAADLTSLFATVALPRDAVISLVQRDGALLARYPESAGPSSVPFNTAQFEAAFSHAGTAVRHLTSTNGEWRIRAMGALADYPIAISVSRSANQVLAEWFNQILWLGAFAIIAAIAIGMMVYVIARQFKTHADLAAMRAERIEAEKIEIERARLAAETELLKAERLSVLGQLTATVAHELRNPLSAIRNSLFTVKELAANAGVKLDRPVGRMERGIERCDRIISDLLEYTRNRELHRTCLRFDRWLADVLGEQSLPAPVEIATELGAGELAVAADADRIRRVVINLVENAAQALAEMPADREKCILVRTSGTAGEVVLTIEDTGPGIPPDNLGRIFEPLFSTKSFGTGLGLPTVKQIVNQHGGTIAVESEVGRGTCVTVRLPVRTEAEAEEVKVAA
jgi:signal transduction histidine kinase